MRRRFVGSTVAVVAAASVLSAPLAVADSYSTGDRSSEAELVDDDARDRGDRFDRGDRENREDRRDWFEREDRGERFEDREDRNDDSATSDDARGSGERDDREATGAGSLIQGADLTKKEARAVRSAIRSQRRDAVKEATAEALVSLFDDQILTEEQLNDLSAKNGARQIRKELRSMDLTRKDKRTVRKEIRSAAADARKGFTFDLSGLVADGTITQEQSDIITAIAANRTQR